jgi:aspartate/methionine/tyrosine aminotransferase
VLTGKELRGVAELAEEHDFLVVSDEIYSEFIWDGRKHISIASLPGMRERTVVIVSFSKTFAMTGWRLGYLIADGALVDEMLKMQGNMILCPAAHVQVAGVAALKGPWEPIERMAEEYNRRREFMAKRLNEIEGVSCPKPEGAFYLFPDISEASNSSVEFCRGLMEEKRVAIVPGSAFGPHGEGHVRIPLVKPMEVLEEAANRIEAYIREHKA